MSVPVKAGKPELTRVLRLWDSVAVIVGIIIGSGIFFTPTTVIRQVPHAGMALLVWIAGGIAALCGALAYSELASAWPKTGGTYVYLRECFNPLISFLFGWANLWIIRPSAVAGISVIFANYVAYFVPLHQTGIKLIAISAILIVSIINYLGVRRTSALQNVLTTIKIFSLLFIAVVGLLFFSRHDVPVSLDSWFPETFQWSYFSAFAAALVGVYWTYDGWVEITNVAGEVLEPGKTIPRALIIAALGITLVYVLVNMSYLHVLSVEGVRASERVASDAMVRVLGPIGGTIIAVAVIISTFGALNGTTLTGPRIIFAMAVDGLFFSWARKINPRYKTPSTAIAMQALLAIPLVATWTFDQVATYFVFMSLIFYSLGTLAIFKLRKMKDLPAVSYRTWGYPWTPLIFLVFAVGVLINTVVTSVEQAGLGLLILSAGVPVYYVWKRIKERSSRRYETV